MDKAEAGAAPAAPVNKAESSPASAVPQEANPAAPVAPVHVVAPPAVAAAPATPATQVVGSSHQDDCDHTGCKQNSPADVHVAPPSLVSRQDKEFYSQYEEVMNARPGSSTVMRRQGKEMDGHLDQGDRDDPSRKASLSPRQSAEYGDGFLRAETSGSYASEAETRSLNEDEEDLDKRQLVGRPRQKGGVPMPMDGPSGQLRSRGSEWKRQQNHRGPRGWQRPQNDREGRGS